MLELSKPAQMNMLLSFVPIEIKSKVRQKTIQNLGVVTNKNREELLAIGRRIIAKHNDHEIISSIDKWE